MPPTPPAWNDNPHLPADLRTSAGAYARRGLFVLGVNVLMVLLLAYVQGRMDAANLSRQLVYWSAVSLSTWAIVDMGRYVVGVEPDSYWPRGFWGLALPVLGCGLGFAIGIAVGDLINGVGLYSNYTQGRRNLKVDLLVSMSIGVVFSSFYFLRGGHARQQSRLMRAERDLTLARLNTLQAQLEPHMLFNTLANLRVLIGVDPPRAQDMLDHMIAFLRATLDGSRSAEHPLSAEFKRLSDYLALMAMRMGPRLTVRLDLPDDLRDVPVPTLLLQPLVENGIRHGIEPKVAGGVMEVSARRDGQTLRLTVRDTGVGLAADRTANAATGNDLSAEPARPHSAPGAASTHFGLTQVRERLATLHGPHAHLTLENAHDGRGGVEACVHLPLPNGS